MKFHCTIVALGLASALAGLSTAASATTIVTTFEGVAYGWDVDGLFGTADATFSGTKFTAVYTTDDTTPGATVVSNPGAFSYVRGTGGIAPTTATMTINGHSYQLNSNYAGELWRIETSPGLAGEVNASACSNSCGTELYTWVDSYHVPFTTDWDYRTPLSYTVETGDVVDGLFQAGSAYMRLKPTYVSVAVMDIGGGVPEPASWALMIMGFGMAGHALRRRASEPRSVA